MSLASLVSGDATELLEPPKHTLNRVLAAIKHGQKARLPTAVDLGRNVGRGSGHFDLSADRVAVEVFIRQKDETVGRSSSCAPAVQLATCQPVSKRAGRSRSR